MTRITAPELRYDGSERPAVIKVSPNASHSHERRDVSADLGGSAGRCPFVCQSSLLDQSLKRVQCEREQVIVPATRMRGVDRSQVAA